MTIDIAASTIVQQACRIMEVTPPSSFDDAGELASSAREQYPNALGMALESYDWSFARTIRSIPPKQLAPPDIADPDLPFTFALPAGCVKLRHVYNACKWRIDGSLLRADTSENIIIRYTFRADREANLPKTFQLVVSYQLASLLGPRFVTTRTKRESIRSEATDAMRIAVQNDAWTASHHRIDGTPDEGDWVSEARR